MHRKFKNHSSVIRQIKFKYVRVARVDSITITVLDFCLLVSSRPPVGPGASVKHSTHICIVCVWCFAGAPLHMSVCVVQSADRADVTTSNYCYSCPAVILRRVRMMMCWCVHPQPAKSLSDDVNIIHNSEWIWICLAYTSDYETWSSGNRRLIVQRCLQMIHLSVELWQTTSRDAFLIGLKWWYSPHSNIIIMWIFLGWESIFAAPQCSFRNWIFGSLETNEFLSHCPVWCSVDTIGHTPWSDIALLAWFHPFAFNTRTAHISSPLYRSPWPTRACVHCIIAWLLTQKVGDVFFSSSFVCISHSIERRKWCLPSSLETHFSRDYERKNNFEKN